MFGKINKYLVLKADFNCKLMFCKTNFILPNIYFSKLYSRWKWFNLIFLRISREFDQSSCFPGLWRFWRGQWGRWAWRVLGNPQETSKGELMWWQDVQHLRWTNIGIQYFFLKSENRKHLNIRSTSCSVQTLEQKNLSWIVSLWE